MKHPWYLGDDLKDVVFTETDSESVVDEKEREENQKASTFMTPV